MKALVSIIIALCLSLCSQAYAYADEAPALKSDTPKLDTAPAPKSESKHHEPLRANLQHNEKIAPQQKKLYLRRPSAVDNGYRRAGINDRRMNINVESSFGIVGVRFVLAGGRPPLINRVFPGTPAEKVGMQINDTIVAVDGVPTIGLTKEEVYDLIVGSPGTPVSISIKREGDFRVFNCTRMDINEITDPQVRRDYMMSM